MSYPQDHDFSGLDEGGSDLSLFQTQFADSIRRNHRDNLLAADQHMVTVVEAIRGNAGVAGATLQERLQKMSLQRSAEGNRLEQAHHSASTPG